MFDNVEEVIQAIANGDMVVLADDENRENEGDLIMAAEKVTPAAINFMCTYGRGLICVPVTAERARELALAPMAPSLDRYQTAFTVSVDARHGITTGISAADRARTIQILGDPKCQRHDLTVPGHIFPLVAKAGGVIERAGHTEAAVDLARLAGCTPAAAICEILNADGTMARLEALQAFVIQHQLKWCRIADLIRYRQKHGLELKSSGHVNMPSRYSARDFELHAYEASDGKEHVALVYGEVAGRERVLARIHSECLTGDVFGSARCDCGQQLDEALQRIVKEGSGVLVYLRQEGRGIGLVNKIRAYKLQDHKGLDTVQANIALGFAPDLRDYSVAAAILKDLQVQSVRLMTNNPEKVSGLAECGVAVADRLPLVIPPGERNSRYLKTKRERMGHLL